MKRFNVIAFVSLLFVIISSCGIDKKEQDASEAINDMEQVGTSEEQKSSEPTEVEKEVFILIFRTQPMLL